MITCYSTSYYIKHVEVLKAVDTDCEQTENNTEIKGEFFFLCDYFCPQFKTNVFPVTSLTLSVPSNNTET